MSDIVINFEAAMHHILIVEDEVDIAELVAFNLKREGFQVDMVHDGAEGLVLERARRPETAVLHDLLRDPVGDRDRGGDRPEEPPKSAHGDASRVASRKFLPQ